MGKIVNGVANDYDCEQYEDWNKHLKYCNEPIILTRWQDPTIDELKQEIEYLKKQYKKEEKKLFHGNEILQQRINKAVEYINKYEYEKYCPSPYEKDKYIMREEKEGQDLLEILRGDE